MRKNGYQVASLLLFLILLWFPWMFEIRNTVFWFVFHGLFFVCAVAWFIVSVRCEKKILLWWSCLSKRSYLLINVGLATAFLAELVVCFIKGRFLS